MTADVWLTGRRGQALAAAIGVLALALAWFGVVDPVWSWYRDRDLRLEQRQVLLQRMQAVAATLPALRAASARAGRGDNTPPGPGGIAPPRGGDTAPPHGGDIAPPHQAERSAPQQGDGATIMLPGASDAVAAADLQERIQKMAAAAGTSLTAVETLPATRTGKWQKIVLRISLNASWPVLMDLLQAIEQSPTRILIDDVHFHSTTLLAHPAVLPVQASMVVYGFRPAETGTGT
jgi:general secretion pathway protein M